MRIRSPLIPGFNPDPSITEADGTYYLATSSFEYLPGIPIYRSTDLETWELISHVITRPGQLQVDGVFTGGGAWAPTIRFHNGQFWLAVTDAGGRGTLIFTAADPAGPWSDGMLTDINGIDPDLAWDDDGTLVMTFSGLKLTGELLGQHLGIQQVRLDPATGRSLEAPRNLWSGTGLMFPEAPHLYRIGEWWYLMIAEGGTERGHAVSIARSRSITGPFEGCPANPILSARSTARPIQNTGHGDLVRTPDGAWAMVLLGMRTRGMTRSFSSLGRETFITTVTWDDDGWPSAAPVGLSDDAEPTVHDALDTPALGLGWVGVRTLPQSLAQHTSDGFVLRGTGETMDGPAPTFIGQRLHRLQGMVSARVRVDGVGGLSLRYDEHAHYDLELNNGRLIARTRLASMTHEEAISNPGTPALRDTWVTLAMRFRNPAPGFGVDAQTCDHIEFGWVDDDGTFHLGLTRDGRYLSAEVTCSFTGRVIGVYSTIGTLTMRTFDETDLT